MRPYDSTAKRTEALLSYVSFRLYPATVDDAMWERQDLWQEAQIVCWHLDKAGKPLLPNNIKNAVLDRIRAAVPGSRAQHIREWPEFIDSICHDDEREASDVLRKLADRLTELQRQITVDYWLLEMTIAELVQKHKMSEWAVRQELAGVRKIALGLEKKVPT